MILKLQEVKAHEKDLLEKLKIVEEAHAEENNVMNKRIKELKDKLSRLRLGNEEAQGSKDNDTAAKEVA